MRAGESVRGAGVVVGGPDSVQLDEVQDIISAQELGVAKVEQEVDGTKG